ncbi:MAG TPA: efflux RND transporter periplasmic adaptor subunit [Verrucomicrobiae bacterium]|nr:efflux RND transporter periplasmic adaptor subunit [Verrucomicrobiae bacterium]
MNLLQFPLRAVLLAVALCGCSRITGKSSAKTPEPIPVSVVRLHRGEITRSIALPGNVFALQSATLYAKIPGYLKTIAVDKGDAVTQSEVLAQIEDPELLAERPKYEAELAVAETNYARIRAAAQKAPDLVMPETVDDVRGQRDVARANLKRINDLLAYSQIIAPFDGIVTRRWVDPGAFIPAATSGSVARPTAVVTVMDFSRVRVDVAVPENEVPFVTTATPATITAEELPGRAFTGDVTRFEYALDQTTKTMTAEIEIANPDRALRPGMYVTVKLGIERKADALLAPVDVVLMEKIGPSVFTVEDGKALKTPVKTGFSDGTNVEIVSGIQSGQAVILLGNQTLNNGQPVTTK